MNIINRIYVHLSKEVQQPLSTKLFVALVYFWFLVNVLMVFDVRYLLWDAKNIFYRQGHTDNFIENFFYQLIYDTQRFNLIFYAHIFASLVSIFDFRLSVIPRWIAWCTGWLLFYSAVQAFNSGMMIIISLSLFAGLIFTKAKTPVGISVTNLMRYACMIQICIVYLVATIYKLSGQQWLAGDALYYTFHIHQYSSTLWMNGRLENWKLALTILTYLGLIYQLVFPILIWFKRSRMVFLIIGISFHLFIGLFMHLWDFALAMIFSYTIFLNDEMTIKLLKPLGLIRKK